jgi:hypothetical protein
VGRLVIWIKEAVAQHVPLSKPVSISVLWRSSDLTQLVRNARGAGRKHRRMPRAEAWRTYLEALSAKRSAIGKAKAAQFKQAVAEAARGRKGIWPLAKWAKERSHLPPTPLTISNLVSTSRIATTPSEKAIALKSQFFSPCLMLISPISPMTHTLPKHAPQ